MGSKRYLLYVYFIFNITFFCNGCTMVGVNNWLLPQNIAIVDIERGVVFSRATSDILGIQSINFQGGLNGGPYLSANLDNSEFSFMTSNNYEQYEELETLAAFSAQVTFNCVGGTTSSLLFLISVTDTNNNHPTFFSNNLALTVYPPLPPNYLLTGCLTDIIVRDIDLTTQSIIYEIEENPYFEISFGERSTSNPKDYHAVLKTKSFIRSLPEPLIYTITATDVDLTDDEPLTSSVQIQINADDNFELPEELAFSKAYYLSDLVNEDINLEESIYLSNGYDNYVEFALDDEFTSYFELIPNGNDLTIIQTAPLPEDLLNKSELYITISAKRELTNGANTVLIVRIIKDPSPVFNKYLFNGNIHDEELQHETILLTEFNDREIVVLGEYNSLFQSAVENGEVKITSTELSNLPDDTKFITLELHADEAIAVLVFDVSRTEGFASFDKTIYQGSIHDGVLDHELITLTNFVGDQIEIIGEYNSMFQSTIENGEVKITSTELMSLPDDAKFITLELHADEALAVLIYNVSRTEFVASFDKNIYQGSIYDGLLDHELVTLTNFDGGQIDILGEFSSLFRSVVENGEVKITSTELSNLPDDAKIVTLELHADEAVAVLVFDVSLTEAVASFDRTIYRGSIHDGVLDHELITLSNFNGSQIDILGEYNSLFQSTIENGEVKITSTELSNLPGDATFITLELHADEATAVIVFDVSQTEVVKSFDKTIYQGSIHDGVLDHELINLMNFDGDQIEIKGDYNTLFQSAIENGEVKITITELSNLPDDAKFIILELHADEALAVLVFDVSRTEETEASFDKILYRGTLGSGGVIHEIITFTGDNSSQFEIDGVFSDQFTVDLEEANVVVTLKETALIPDEVQYISLELKSGNAHSVLLLDVLSSDETGTFDKILYEGSVNNGEVIHETISLLRFNGDEVEISGAYSDDFTATLTNEVVTVTSRESLNLPSDVSFITLVLIAGDTRTVLLLEVITVLQPNTEASFDKVLYSGTLQNREVTHEVITLTAINSSLVEIDGVFSDQFSVDLEETVIIVTLRETSLIPEDVQYISLELKTGNAHSVLLLDVLSSDVSGAFDKILYEGTVNQGEVIHETISLLRYNGDEVEISGAYSDDFTAIHTNGEVIVTSKESLNLPSDLSFITLVLIAGDARTVLFLEIVTDLPESQVSFDKLLYEGTIQNGEAVHETITLSGFNNSEILIEGLYKDQFTAVHQENNVVVSITDMLTLPSETSFISLELNAGTANAVLILRVLPSENFVGFEKNLYNGKIENGEITHDPITLQGYDGELIQTQGEYGDQFTAYQEGNNVFVIIIDTLSIPETVKCFTLEIKAGVAHTILLLEVISSDLVSDVSFDQLLYKGTIQGNDIEHENITLIGFNETQLNIIGEYSDQFNSIIQNEIVTIYGIETFTLPDNINFLLFTLNAGDASASLLFEIFYEELPEEIVPSFDKVLYIGVIEDSLIQHEPILINDFDDSIVEITGLYSYLFEAISEGGVVEVQFRDSLVLPGNVSYIGLELQAGKANAVLIFDVVITDNTEPPLPPVVTFSSPTYTVTVATDETGIVGRILATTDNGEPVTYSLSIDNVHLQERLTISREGELFLSSPANIGDYQLVVAATTTITQVRATADISISVTEAEVCEIEDTKTTDPLIIIDRDEEQPYLNLVVLNRTEYPNCQYQLINKWPTNQNWIYVDSIGLHTRSIDREDLSIAFMALSQVQVELNIICDGDEIVSRSKKVTDVSERLDLDWLGPYDYGNNKWILSDSISYDSSKTLVNLIVNDINDNFPIFLGKENEPIVVGYPEQELQEIIQARSLIELKATDADVGENAELVYSSNEPSIAVSPTTGFVHVTDGATLVEGQILTVRATDQNGNGLTGSIDVMVKLLDKNHIAVVTIQNAFLEDESSLLEKLSTSIGYDIKALKANVIPHYTNDEQGIISRKKRQSIDTNGVSLQIYVYGLIEREPVEVHQLTEDINNNADASVNVANTVALEDYLEGWEIPVRGNDTGFFVATIVLSVLLFIVLLCIAGFVFMQRRNNTVIDYDYDATDISPRNDSFDSKPRIDIDELRKSEKKLQERLEADIREVSIEPNSIPGSSSRDIDLLDLSPNIPIVIQSFDKLKSESTDSDEEDEFGEKPFSKHRKPTVSFNQNVEKIIHLDDIASTTSDNDLFTGNEVYKF